MNWKRFATFGAMLAIPALANVSLPTIFTNNMVLQRDMPVKLWGKADNGEKVTVKFQNQTKATTAEDGRWSVTLDPLKEDAQGATLIVAGNNTVSLENVLVGDVWLLSGQSNMEMPVMTDRGLKAWHVDNAEEEVKNANYPNIRLYRGNNYKPQQEPQQDNPGREWKVCNPANIVGFSAAGYFFGRKVMQELNVPIGLISINWGGTRIEPWTSPLAFRKFPSLKHISIPVDAKIPGTEVYQKLTSEVISNTEKWLAEAKAAVAAGKPIPVQKPFPSEFTPFTDRQNPTVLYNSMVAPLRGLACKGVLWYQGESNRRDGALYIDKMAAMTYSFREAMGQPELPLYFVQLAPYNYGNDTELPIIWEAQQKYADSDKNVGMIVTTDIGNFKDIHPLNKQDVGLRLALLALKYTYGKDIVADSPFFESWKADGAKAVVTFRNAVTLKSKDGKPIRYFELAGPNGVYYDAEVQLDGNRAILTSPNVTEPKAVRFGWHADITVNLVNEAGLPAGSFRDGEIDLADMVTETIPEAKGFSPLYQFNPAAATKDGGKAPNYTRDNSAAFKGRKVRKYGYYMQLIGKDNKTQYVFVACDAFTQDLTKAGLPTVSTKTMFAQKVKGLVVNSNVPTVKNGSFPEGNIEFWPHNYGKENGSNIPGADGNKYDFGDKTSTPELGYGSMQIHNFALKQTIFAFNNFRTTAPDIGIGNNPNPSAQPDWTFSKSLLNFQKADILVFALFE
ncbi:MAG: hypothetical protein IJJ26_13470 [Victivallales bacterium]|nr:hypothetical protein [Victivallales bacterium]